MGTTSTRAIPTFDGFSAGTLMFLRELGAHNDKGWFDAHRAEYERDYLAPALAFIEAMRDPLLGLRAVHAAFEEPVPASISSPAFIDHCVARFRPLTPGLSWVAELGGSDHGVR